MTLKEAAYTQVMNTRGMHYYDPYTDPNYLNSLEVDDAVRMAGKSLSLGAAVGGVGKTYSNMRKGRFGTFAPATGGIGLVSLMLND